MPDRYSYNASSTLVVRKPQGLALNGRRYAQGTVIVENGSALVPCVSFRKIQQLYTLGHLCYQHDLGGIEIRYIDDNPDPADNQDDSQDDNQGNEGDKDDQTGDLDNVDSADEDFTDDSDSDEDAADDGFDTFEQSDTDEVVESDQPKTAEESLAAFGQRRKRRRR